MSVVRALGRDVAWNLASDATSRGASLWLAVFCARTLGVENFGRMTLALVVVQYVWLLGDAALNAGYATREIARDRTDPDRLAGLFWKTRLASAAVLTAAGLAAVAFLPVTQALRPTLTAALIFFLAIAAFPDWLLRGQQSFRALALANLAAAVTLVGATLWLLPRHPDPALASFLWAASFGAAALCSLPAAWRAIAPRHEPHPPREIRAERAVVPGHAWGPHFRRSIVFSIGSILAIGCMQLPTLMVGAWGTAAETGRFGAGFRFLLGGVALVAVLWWPLLPVLTGAARDPRRFRRAVLKIGLVLIAATLPIAALVSWLAHPLLVRVYGAEFGAGAAVLAVVIWALPAYAATGLLEQSCLAIGREHLRARIWGAAFAFSLVISTFLVPRLEASVARWDCSADSSWASRSSHGRYAIDCSASWRRTPRIRSRASPGGSGHARSLRFPRFRWCRWWSRCGTRSATSRARSARCWRRITRRTRWS